MSALRLLYICGTYAPRAFAGSELSAHTLVRELLRRGLAEVLVVSDERYTGGRPGLGTYDDVPIRGLAHADRRAGIAAAIEEFRPDVVLTQLVWADVALQEARHRGVPTIFRVASLPVHLDLRAGGAHEPTAILVASRYVQEIVGDTTGRESVVLPPAIDLTRVVAPPSMRRPRYVTAFNPIDLKGGGIVRRVAELLPEYPFAVVPGWGSLRGTDGRFDPEQMARAFETIGQPYDGWLPVDSDLSGLPNLTVLAPREAVHEIFAVTRLLLVPSLWEEAFGRVALEAFANGIPVLASPVGGLREHAAAGGRLVEGHPDPEAWAAAIRDYDDPGYAAEQSRRGLDYVARAYDLGRIVESFAELAAALAHRPRRSEA